MPVCMFIVLQVGCLTKNKKNFGGGKGGQKFGAGYKNRPIKPLEAQNNNLLKENTQLDATINRKVLLLCRTDTA